MSAAINFFDGRVPDRFWEKCIPEPMSGCWLWLASRSREGYARIAAATLMGRRWVPAMQLSYVLLVGAIPDGLELDHRCRVRACVNPAHLEPVTHAENMRRGHYALLTACPLGHPLDGDNLYLNPDGSRECRTCRRRTRREHYVRERAALGKVPGPCRNS